MSYNDLPDGFDDAIHCHLKTKYSFMDRIRILFGRTARMHLQINTQNKPGEVKTEVIRSSVDRLIPPKGNTVGYECKGISERCDA